MDGNLFTEGLVHCVESWKFLLKSEDMHAFYVSIKCSLNIYHHSGTLKNIIPLYATKAELSQLLA